MKEKSTSNYLASIFWGIFLIGLMEILFYLIGQKESVSFFIVASMLAVMIITTAVKTFQPKVGYYHEMLPYLIHPVFLFLGFLFFIIFNTDLYLQQCAIILTSLSYFILFSENFSDLTHKAHDGVKFLIIFFLYNTIFEAVHYFQLNLYLIPLFVTLTTLLFFMHMFWRLKVLGNRYLFVALIFSGLIGVLSYFLGAYYIFASFIIITIILLSIYYVLWGIMHHTILKNLTFPVLMEYLLVSGIVITMIVGLITGW